MFNILNVQIFYVKNFTRATKSGQQLDEFGVQFKCYSLKNQIKQIVLLLVSVMHVRLLIRHAGLKLSTHKASHQTTTRCSICLSGMQLTQGKASLSVSGQINQTRLYFVDLFLQRKLKIK